jgi:V-type H+-transporting ATPase subunit C
LTVSISGNLSTKSLTPIVDPKLLVQDSEYIETHLIVVPGNAKKDFIKEYETISPMVVPRSAVEVAKDDEFVLFAVATFKKHSAEFLAKCREQKWTPRQYKYVEGGRQEEQRELDRVTNEERKVCGEALRMGRTGWSESVMIWIHVMTLRVFVEAVLRYGLPLDYVSVLVKVSLSNASQFTSLITFADYIQAGAQGQGCTGLKLLVPGRQCLWTGQARQDYQGRRCAELRDGSRWFSDWRGTRIHGIRILRDRVSLANGAAGRLAKGRQAEKEER